jgi:hypothetical protein
MIEIKRADPIDIPNGMWHFMYTHYQAAPNYREAGCAKFTIVFNISLISAALLITLRNFY